MRARPRLVPSARIAANSADLSAARSPVRRWVNRSAYPVQPSTSLRTSVIRTLGSIAFSRMARSRAASGTAGLARAMYNVPFSISTPSRSPRAARAITKFSQRCGTVVHVAGGIGLLIDTDVACGFGGQQVVFEGAVITAARHPDIAAPKSLAQGSEHCRFIQPAVSCAGGKDQLAPFRR